MLLDIKPGDVLQHNESKILYLVVSVGTTVDGFKPMLIHKDNFFRRSLDPEDYNMNDFTKVPTGVIRSWDRLEQGDRVVCINPIEGGCVNEVTEYDGHKYLVSTEYMWRIDQFYEEDYRKISLTVKTRLEGEVTNYDGTV